MRSGILKVFISYSHKDEGYREELERHLSTLRRNGYITTWTDRKIIPGEEWKREIAKELEDAKLILLLISADFLASDYCYEIEMHRALERYEKREAVVIPVILRACDWSDTPFAKLQGLPVNAQPVKDWADQDKAFLNVVEGIKVLLSAHLKDDLFEIPYGRSMKTPQEMFAEMRRGLINTKDPRMIRKLLYELEEFEKIHGQSFEAMELKRDLQRGLDYDGERMMPVTPAHQHKQGLPKKSVGDGGGCVMIIVASIALLLLIYFIFVR